MSEKIWFEWDDDAEVWAFRRDGGPAGSASMAVGDVLLDFDRIYPALLTRAVIPMDPHEDGARLVALLFPSSSWSANADPATDKDAHLSSASGFLMSQVAALAEDWPLLRYQRHQALVCGLELSIALLRLRQLSRPLAALIEDALASPDRDFSIAMNLTILRRRLQDLARGGDAEEALDLMPYGFIPELRRLLAAEIPAEFLDVNEMAEWNEVRKHIGVFPELRHRSPSHGRLPAHDDSGRAAMANPTDVWEQLTMARIVGSSAYRLEREGEFKEAEDRWRRCAIHWKHAGCQGRARSANERAAYCGKVQAKHMDQAPKTPHSVPGALYPSGAFRLWMDVRTESLCAVISTSQEITASLAGDYFFTTRRIATGSKWKAMSTLSEDA